MSVPSLETAARDFGPKAARRKLEILRAISRQRRISPRDLLGLRDSLNFLRAYPDNPEILATAGELLAGLRERVESLPAGADTPALWNMGFPGAYNSNPFSFPVLLRMTQARPGRLEIDWDQFEDDSALTDALIQTVTPSEMQGLEDIELSFSDWLTGAMGESKKTDLEFVLGLLGQSGLTPFQQSHLFDACEVPVRYDLSEPGTGRGEIEFPAHRVRYQRGPIDRSRPPLRRIIRRPLPEPHRAGPAEGRMLLALALKELCARNLEIYPLSYSDPRDVSLIDCGRGFQILLAGVLPEHRSAFDTLFYFLVAKNGVAIGYGPASAFVGCCELGINLFPEFRGAEIWYVYGQLMRVLHHLLGVECFFLTKYAMGEENEDAIRTGAFWFYRRMGFRTTNPAVEKLAIEEEAKMGRRPRYRSDRKTLRKLAHTEAYLDLSGGRCRPVSFGKLGVAITRALSNQPADDRGKAERLVFGRATRVLGIRNLPYWSEDERRALEAAAPMVTALGVESWPLADRLNLLRYIRAKGRRSEAKASRLSARNESLRKALEPYTQW